jgi:hypothetical protein
MAKKTKYYNFEAATKRFRGRELDEDECIGSLMAQGCHFAGKSIDIAKAKILGNKSWGRISFLCRFKGYDCKDTDPERKTA